MKKNMSNAIGSMLIVLCLIGVLCTQTSYGQNVYKITKSQTTLSLDERWNEGKNLAGEKNISGIYWIGYCISRLMDQNSYIGSFDTRRKNRTSLFETIYGIKIESDSEPDLEENCCSFSGTFSIGDWKPHREKVIKKVAVLFLLDSKGKAIKDTKISNMSLHVDFEQKPLIWLEEASDDESVELLQSLFKNTDEVETEKGIVTAVGLHQASKSISSFLSNIIKSKRDEEVREEAIFWLGEQDDNDFLPLLSETARDDNSEDVREKAIFAISQMDSEQSLDSLIGLARKGHDKDMRSKALFWLSEKASKKALKTIKDVIDNDGEDTDVQRQALFALTQNSDDKEEGVNELIKIAKSHRSRKLRKEAIFWLGQSDSPKAFEALVEMVKK